MVENKESIHWDMESWGFSESQNRLQVKFYKGKVALEYSKKVVCLVINKKQEQSINKEHLKYEFCINFGKKDWWIPETIARA